MKGDRDALVDAMTDDEFGELIDSKGANGSTPARGDSLETDRPTVVVRKLEDIAPEPVTWLWKGRIPRAKTTVVDADPGMGKTTVACDVAARVTKGDRMPDGTPTIPGGVVFLTAEDGLADTIRPRLDAAGADSSRVFTISILDRDGFEQPITIPDDLDALRSLIAEETIRLVVVDPLNGFLASYVDSNKDHPVRRAMAPLAQLAEETGVAVLLIRHLNKSGLGRALYRGGGSIGISAAARSVLMIAADPQDSSRRILAPVKHNLTVPPSSLAYRLETAANGASRVVWEEGESPYTADALCVAASTDDDERSARGEARDFLEELLRHGPVKANEILREARQVGVSERTLRRAKSELGIVAKRQGFGPDGVWVWAIDVQQKGEDTYGADDDASDDEARTSHRRPPIDCQGPLATFMDQAKTFIEGRPDADRDQLLRHLGGAGGDATRVVDELVATGNPRFAHLAHGAGDS